MNTTKQLILIIIIVPISSINNINKLVFKIWGVTILPHLKYFCPRKLPKRNGSDKIPSFGSLTPKLRSPPYFSPTLLIPTINQLERVSTVITYLSNTRGFN